MTLPPCSLSLPSKYDLSHCDESVILCIYLSITEVSNRTLTRFTQRNRRQQNAWSISGGGGGGGGGGSLLACALDVDVPSLGARHGLGVLTALKVKVTAPVILL